MALLALGVAKGNVCGGGGSDMGHRTTESGRGFGSGGSAVLAVERRIRSELGGGRRSRAQDAM